MAFSLLLSFLFAIITSVIAIDPGFPYGSVKVRGVNLGGWLVLEPWITPSLFEGDNRIIDEWTFGQYQDKTYALERLTRHWNTFITEEDFAAIAEAGLNHVRIPVGYWALEVAQDEPFITGQLPYLLKGVEWAEKYGLKVIVDLHGAPGSQNGFDNSGRALPYPTWHTKPENVQRTNAVIKTLASMFAQRTSVAPIIAPLNEPAGYRGSDVLAVTRQYWKDSYDSIRYPFGNMRESNTVVMIHDAFQPLSYWKDFMASPGSEGVAMDTHIYSVFSDAENQRSLAQHIQNVCSKQSTLANFHLWTVVGEWTPAFTDCTPFLNGKTANGDKGSRYDGTYPGSSRIGSCEDKIGKGSTYSESYKKALRQFWEAQAITYEKGAGWIQWTWKVEADDSWSYKAGLQHGWIPKNPTDYKYPDICSTGP